MKPETAALKKIPFDVVIPNLDGDGVAETIPIEVEAYADAESGEDILTPESLELIEKTQARHMGLMSADDIRELREKRLSLTQEEMSQLLQIGAKTYTRWESGRARPSRSMNLMLRAIDDGQLDINYLYAVRSPNGRKEWLEKQFERVFLSCAAHITPTVTAEFREELGRAFDSWSTKTQVSGQSVGPDLVVHLTNETSNSPWLLAECKRDERLFYRTSMPRTIAPQLTPEHHMATNLGSRRRFDFSPEEQIS